MSPEDGFPALGASPLETSLTNAITYRDKNKVEVYVLEIYPSERFHLEAAIQYHFIAKLIENGCDVLVVWRDSNLNPFFLTRMKPSSSTEQMLNIWKNSLLEFLHRLKLDNSKIKFLIASQVWTDLISPNDEKGRKQNVLRLTLMMHLRAVSEKATKSLEEHHYHCDPKGREMTPDKAFGEAAEALAVQYIAYSSLIDAIYPLETKLVLIRDQSHKELSDYIQDAIDQGETEFAGLIEDGGSQPQGRYDPLDIIYTNANYHYYTEPEPKSSEYGKGNVIVGWLEHTLETTRTARKEYPPTEPDQSTGILNHLDNDDVISDVLSKVMKSQFFDAKFFAVEPHSGGRHIKPADYEWINACFDIYRKSLLHDPGIKPIFLSHDASLKFLPKTLWNQWCEISTIYWDAVAAKDCKTIDNEKWVAKSHLKEKKIGEKVVRRKNHAQLYQLIEADIDMSSGEPRSKPPFVRVLEDDSTVMNSKDVIVEVAYFSKIAAVRKKHNLPPGSQHFRLLGNALQFSSSPIDFVPIKPENSS